MSDPSPPAAITSASAATGSQCCNETWEAAYSRFETPEQEIRKFVQRLSAAGADAWPRDAATVDLFCGRGGGLHALTRLGFTKIEGVDLSPTLLAQYQGPAHCVVADCRKLPFEDGSKDVVIVQGGLHHLPKLPEDLDQVLREVHRILKPKGLFVAVEPWLTPFLRLAHALCENRLIRRFSPKFDALAVMIENERTTYEQWLSQPGKILACFQTNFVVDRQVVGWGKIMFIGRKRLS